MKRYAVDLVVVVSLSAFTALAIVAGAAWSAGALIACAYFGGRLSEQRVWHRRILNHKVGMLEAFSDAAERALASDELPDEIADELRDDYQAARQEIARLRPHA